MSLPVSDRKVLLLGGTAEAADMAARLEERGISVLTSLAGRTREPATLAGKVRIGGFGGAEGLAAFAKENAITVLLDMTHPFATRMSDNARQASGLTGIPLLAFHRPCWERVQGDIWIEVPDIDSAVTAIPAHSNTFLALGSQHIEPFASRTDVHFLVRMVDRPQTAIPLPDHTLLPGKPGSVEDEFALLADRKITHIVCRNSGGKASYAKIAAARLLGVPVIMIARSPVSQSMVSLDEFERTILAALA